MEVRTVDPSETELCTTLGAFVLDAYLTLPGHVPEPGYEAELVDIAARAAAPATTVLAAFDDDDAAVATGAAATPLGCVTYVAATESPFAEHTDPDAASFRMLGVDPAAQGRGAGRALVDACIDRARHSGRARILLHTTPWMTGAHRLYESLGFSRDPSLDWTPVPDVRLLGYRLEL